MKTKSCQRLAIILALTIALASCSKPTPTEEPVRAVKVMTVKVESMTAEPEFAGEVRAQAESRLGFRVAGKLVKRQAEVGQRVKPGQLIAQLDPQDYVLAADAMKAQLMVAITNRDLAVAEFKRFKELKEQNFVSGVELDRREAAVKAAASQVEQAQAQVASMGNQSLYANLAADVAGVVTAVEAEVGQVVSAGTPIVRVAHDGARDVLFSVPEDKVGLITLGSAVDVKMWSVGSTFKGVVREKAALADPVTRTYLVKVALEANDGPALGSTVTVVPQVLSTKGIQVIKLPTSALKQDGKTSAVWILDPARMTLKSQPVQIAAVDGNSVVVSAGLVPGMQVVTAGVHVVTAGQKVTVYKPKAERAQETKSPASGSAVVAAMPASSASATK